MDAAGLIVEFNPAAEQTFGYRRSDVIGQLLADKIIPPALRERHQQGLEHWKATGEGPLLGRRVEVEAMRADGAIFAAELTITAIESSGRRLFTAYLRDLTERQRAENEILALNAGLEQQVIERTRALNESRERFYKLFHANPAMMTLTRLSDGCLVDVNDAFCRASDHPREGTVGRSFDELGIWIDMEARADFERRLTAEGRVRDMAITFLSGTGRRDHVLVSAEIIEMEGQPHMLTVALDLNARQKAENALKEALANEQELSRLKSNFVSMVSHEFRTPLGIILSSSEILDRYLDSLDKAERGSN